MKPKDIYVQFDESNRVTHVITGGAVPEKFTRYARQSSLRPTSVVPFMAMIFILAMIACQPIPGPEPTPEPADASTEPAQDAGVDAPACESPAECACASLCRLECMECQPSCEMSITKIVADRIIPFSPECIIDAGSKAEVRGCPGVKCP